MISYFESGFSCKSKKFFQTFLSWPTETAAAPTAFSQLHPLASWWLLHIGVLGSILCSLLPTCFFVMPAGSIKARRGLEEVSSIQPGLPAVAWVNTCVHGAQRQASEFLVSACRPRKGKLTFVRAPFCLFNFMLRTTICSRCYFPFMVKELWLFSDLTKVTHLVGGTTEI